MRTGIIAVGVSLRRIDNRETSLPEWKVGERGQILERQVKLEFDFGWLMAPGRQAAIDSHSYHGGGDAKDQRHSFLAGDQANFLRAVEKGAETRLHVAPD